MAKGWHRESRRHSLASKGIKTAINEKPLVPMEKFRQDNLYRLPVWTERDLKTVLMRINTGKIKPSEIFKQNPILDSGEGIGLTKVQQQKGWDYLKKQHYTLGGKEKESSPYGYREVEIINNPKEIRLKDFNSPRGNYYYPVYEACGGKDCMEYYVEGGKINIIG